MSELLSGHQVKLTVNSTDSSIYSVLQYSGEGNLKYDENGVGFCEYDKHFNIMQTFLSLARKTHIDLVITPECSVPHRLIDNIIHDSDKWPENEKLWCLCSEGIISEEFKLKISELEKDNRLNVIFDKELINYKTNVNALWYLFKVKEKLCVVIQPKQHHMLDFKHEGEARDLSVGSVTYCFDLNGGKPTRNQLVSYICSDMIGLSVANIIHNLSGTNPIILNLQLNPKPFSDKFINFRKAYFGDTGINNQRLIVSNWGIGTVIKDTKIYIEESGNGFFSALENTGLHILSSVLQDKSTFINRLELQKEGIENYLDSDYSIWKFNEDIEAVEYGILKTDAFGRNRELGSLQEPIMINNYEYDITNNEWTIDKRKHCNLKLHSELCDIMEEDYRLKELMSCSGEEKCAKCIGLYADFFFGICFGGLMKEELVVESEKSNRTIKFLNNDSLAKSQEKLRLFKCLVKELRDNNFPKSMKFLENFNIFEINENAAETGSNEVYNLSSTRPGDEHKKAIATIYNTDRIEEVKKLYKELFDCTSDNYKNQILIYYLNDGNNYILYSDPHNVTGIGVSSNSFTKNITSFRGE
ncbi:MAG: hypothetical protein PHP29_05285 [Tissierellia bacterium]|nr:hypothetical protein [Tissierellia bacterium]